MKLLIYRGDTLERTLELSARDFRIGRAAENDIVLEDPEKTVSRFHAELRYEEGAYALIDLNSQNGTWIEGERVRRTGLGPGQTAVMGNFRVAMDSATSPTPVTPQHDTLSGDMPQTLAMPPDSARAALAAAEAGGGAPGASGVGVTPALSVSAAPAGGVTPKRAALSGSQGGKAGAGSIPRPLLYGGAFVFLLLIVGVMYLMRPQPPADPGGQANANAPESAEQIVARYVKDGRAKLSTGDVDGAIEDASRALTVNAGDPDALDLKTKAEERKRQDQARAIVAQQTQLAQAASTSPGSTTPATTPPASTTTPGATTPPTTTPGATTPPATTPPVTTRVPNVPPTVTTPPGKTGPATQPGATTAPGTTPGTTAPGGPATGANTPAARAARRAAAQKDADITKRYTQAKAAMTRGDYAEAVSGFEAIIKERPGYQDSASMLDQARGRIRGQAQQVVQQAADLAAKEDFSAALQQYERARKLDPSLAAIDQGIAAVRRKMKESGDEAYRRARQLDAVGRAQQALPLYERAVSLLSADDPNGKAARERLEALKKP